MKVRVQQYPGKTCQANDQANGAVHVIYVIGKAFTVCRRAHRFDLARRAFIPYQVPDLSARGSRGHHGWHQQQHL